MQELSNLRSSGNAMSVVIIAGSAVVMSVVHDVVTSSGLFKSSKRCELLYASKIRSILMVKTQFKRKKHTYLLLHDKRQFIN